MKKNIHTLLILIFFAISCTSKNETEALNYKYEAALKNQDLVQAEYYVDKMIAIHKNDPKYLKLKIPLLLNRCAKDQTLKVLDQTLAVDQKNINLLLLKAVLLPKGDPQSQTLHKVIKQIEENLTQNSGSRTQNISYLVNTYKLLGYNENDIREKLKSLHLNQADKNTVDEFITIPIEVVTQSITHCT
jgi:predicted Zn-dependent protease